MEMRTHLSNSLIALVIGLLIGGLGFGIMRELASDGVSFAHKTAQSASVAHVGGTSSSSVSIEDELVAAVEEVIVAAIETDAAGDVRYLKITDSCDVDYSNDCLVARGGPGTEFAIKARLREGLVLRTDESIQIDDKMWHKVVFDEWLRYPERVDGEWYVSGAYSEIFYDEGVLEYESRVATGTKRIVVDRSEQTLVAYDGDEVFMETDISTGLELTPTPRGVFVIFRKTPSRYMQGPLPYLADKQYYDLPGVPWNLYFTDGGAVIHGAYWHNSFGTAYSHGCVNLLPEKAEELYRFADLGTTVIVRD